MADKNNNSKDDSNRKEIDKELEKIKNDEKSKSSGILNVVREALLRSMICCYLICQPALPKIIQKLLKNRNDSITCPKCGVELELDPEKKYDFRCPKCKKGFNLSDLLDSK